MQEVSLLVIEDVLAVSYQMLKLVFSILINFDISYDYLYKITYQEHLFSCPKIGSTEFSITFVRSSWCI
jgi:hypothetical protein